MQDQINKLKYKMSIETISKTKERLDTVQSELLLWEQKYNFIVKRKIGSEKLFRTEVKSLVGSDFKNSRIPIVPKSQRRLIGTSRPGDRIIASGRLNKR